MLTIVNQAKQRKKQRIVFQLKYLSTGYMKSIRDLEDFDKIFKKSLLLKVQLEFLTDLMQAFFFIATRTIIIQNIYIHYIRIK